MPVSAVFYVTYNNVGYGGNSAEIYSLCNIQAVDSVSPC